MTKLPSSYRPPWYVAITAAMTCVIGIFYILALHIEGAPDQVFHDAFVGMLTLLTGSIAVARANSNREGNGK